MRITKRQLKKIIREEKTRLLGEAIDADIESDVFDTVFQLLDQELYNWGDVDRWDPAHAESVAAALERVASTVRSEAGTADVY